MFVRCLYTEMAWFLISALLLPPEPDQDCFTEASDCRRERITDRSFPLSALLSLLMCHDPGRHIEQTWNMPSSILKALPQYDLPLCLECEQCGKRVAKEWVELRRLRGVTVQTPIEDLTRRFRCATCHLRTIHGFIPRSRDDVPRFLAGMTIDRVG